MTTSKKLTAIAVDDEQHSLDTLLWEINRHCPEVEVVKTFTDAEEAYTHLRAAEIDVLFLDIHLQSTSGIVLLERLKPVDYHVVFVTAYDEYAIKAFDLSATHYLLKPINGDKLKSAIQRIHETTGQVLSEEQLSNIIGTLKNDLNHVHKIPFPVMNGIEFINPEDIVYIEGDNNYSNIHMQNGNKLVISKTLAYVEPKLSDYPFLRIHKSHIINLKYIAKYVKNDGAYVELENGKKLSVSRVKRAMLNELFR